jgi:hypothetical protein
MQLRLCPFCKTITYYDDAIVLQAATDGSIRTNCKNQDCRLLFWPGTQEDIERNNKKFQGEF